MASAMVVAAYVRRMCVELVFGDGNDYERKMDSQMEETQLLDDDGDFLGVGVGGVGGGGVGGGGVGGGGVGG
eukprot:3364556-Rhodomonas_salina.1